MRLLVDGLRYETLEAPFIGGLKPYAHQSRTLALVREAIAKNETLCILNASVTGSGKTMANFAPAILDGQLTLGIYPTNELIRDQEGALRAYLRQDDVVRIDSDELDYWQDVMHVRGHTAALQPIMAVWEKKALLTNPDILYLMAYDLYGYSSKVGYRERIFQALLNEYPVIAFDEFHLYDTKQVGNVAFIVGTIARLAPNKPHLFIFSSATPSGVRAWAEDRLGLRVEDVTAEATISGRVVCEPIDSLTLLPTDLSRWKGLDTIQSIVWPEVHAYLDQYSTARGVFILDSVYDAKVLAAWLGKKFGDAAVGEIHGYMDKADRAGNLERRFTVGTTTIDVGVDLTGNKAKDFIVFEARSGAQFTQRLGRLGRRGREHVNIYPPNFAWAMVPHYVQKEVARQIKERGVNASEYLSRKDVLNQIEVAYTPREEFRRYWTNYSPYEAAAAKKRILTSGLSDNRKMTEERLRRVICELYRGTRRDVSSEQIAAIGSGIEWSQQELWEQFGLSTNEHKGSDGKMYRDWYLDDLETFRSGGEFQVALYDTLDERRGLFPFKLYNLPFVLRRTVFREMSKNRFEKIVKQKAGVRAERFLRRVERATPLGYLQIEGLTDSVNHFWFQIEESQLMRQSGSMFKLADWEIGAESSCSLETVNAALAKRTLIVWYTQMAPWDLTIDFNLPPMFQLYSLRPIGLNGRSTIGDQFWSVAFGLAAFFLSTVPKSTNGAIFA
ncbi:MAG TPA: type I-D CRISPR-associated helicase Cas3' [Anaerolineae bacterium]|nr:type I-D CRISPR-associated helicase Cas3' [Pyrinomonadaceae bacterium]HKZ87256.1 type I-D CRISPR-associated helicase Cas3' [Anaerolineae bacterium]